MPITEASSITGKLIVLGELEPQNEQAYSIDVATLEIENLSQDLSPINSASLSQNSIDLLLEYRADIYLINLQDESVSKIVGLESYDSKPVWSPSGDRFAFMQNFNTIFIGSPDGTASMVLAQQANSEIDLGNWDPAGKEISYVEYVLTTGPEGIPIAPQSQLRAVNDQGEVRDLVDLNAYPSLLQIGGPAFSPTGEFLAFHAFTGEATRLFLANLSTGEIHELTDVQGNFSRPIWSPDGEHLAAFSHVSNAIAIFSIDGSLVFETDGINGIAVQWVQ